MSHEPRIINGLFAISSVLLAVTACDSQPVCPADRTALRVNNHPPQWACVVRGSASADRSETAAAPSTTSSAPSAPSATSTTSTTSTTTSSELPPVPGSVDPATPTAPSATDPSPTPPSGSCDAVDPPVDDVAIVDKSDPAPSLGSSLPPEADGSYDLVQATFFRSTITDSAVRTLRARLVVRGHTLILGTQDTTVPGNPKEGLGFLLQEGWLTKTCNDPGGDVSGWFFPSPVGQKVQASVAYDRDMGFIRLLVSRSDGATELVFSK